MNILLSIIGALADHSTPLRRSKGNKPPKGLRFNKAIFPRARTRLKPGERNRFGKDEI